MVDTGQAFGLRALASFVPVYLCLWSVSADIIMQDDINCGSLRYPIEHELNNRNRDVVTSHQTDYYLPGKDCVISILGKPGYQFQVTLTHLHVDHLAEIEPETNEPIKCHDYLKIYDSPRVDNAKLLTSPTGLCGSGNLPKRRTFTTSCPFLALEFVTDSNYEPYDGFTLVVEQYKWRNPGNIYPGAGLVPGASWSCYYSEFQPGWDFQGDSLPGNIGQGGGNPDYDKDPNGIECYICSGCSVDNFNPNSNPSERSTESGCYRCAKMYDIRRGDANRACFSQIDYDNLIESLQTPGSELDSSGYLGCRDFVDEYTETKKYCFCDSDKCNTAFSHMACTPLLLLLSVISVLVQSLC